MEILITVLFITVFIVAIGGFNDMIRHRMKVNDIRKGWKK